MTFYNYILDEFFSSITSLGTPVFYVPVILVFIALKVPFALHVLLALLFVELLCIFIKVMYRKERPVLQARDTLYNKIDANSFPSVHSARISLLAAVICWYYKNPFIFAIGIALVLGVGYSRIYLKRHYAGDVLFGFLIGITAAVITIYIT